MPKMLVILAIMLVALTAIHASPLSMKNWFTKQATLAPETSVFGTKAEYSYT